jgi:hypothetical protein
VRALNGQNREEMKEKNMTRMVCGLIVILSGVSAVPAFAQPPAGHSGGPVSSVDQLSTKVKRGDTIYVLDTNARETKGILVEASESSIRLLVEGQIREILAGDVQRVVRRGHGDTLRNGALIGAAAGAVLIGGAAADFCGDYGNSAAECLGPSAVLALMGAGVFAAIGTGIDALIPGRTVVYQATPQRTVRLAPILSGHQAGARLSVAF